MTLGMILSRMESTTPDELWFEILMWILLGGLPFGLGSYVLYPKEQENNTN